MRRIIHLTFAIVMATGVAGTPAFANSCQAGRLMCATAMPAGGYCECTSHGATESGTVVDRPMSRRPVNAKAGGCGAHPDAPGCH
ncbi:hypothetical protein [Acidisphaera sp. L21]|jgi:hypothetical protein|uniref:hypothetical protein n=1 Tax=Acidisphaera sp. L21 TaxID=1641851 RepID=UPI00131AB033|nr:hypothetical protein [Acidisphaera sp. L21]